MAASQTIALSTTLTVFAGGAERLDGALEHAVAPALECTAPEHWAFVRWTSAAGPHLRLALADERWSERDSDALGEQIEAGLERAMAAPPRDPLLPRSPSQRMQDSATGVRRLRLPAGEVPADGLHRLSSELVLAALPELKDGRERCAFGLSLMATTSQAALGRHSGPELWRDAARRRTKTDARGQRLLASLARKAGQLGGELVEIARELRRDGVCADGLARYAAGCRELSTPVAVRCHAHLACNRLGVTPLEEALLALVLAGDRRGSSARGRAVVELECVSKRNEERTVLTDVSLTVHEGEVFVIVGPPGAGKSSVLGVAAGLRVASGGNVRVLGRDPREGARELWDAPAVAMPDSELVEARTTRENVDLHLKTNGGGAGAIVDAVLAEVGMHEQAGTAVADLQAGQRRRLAIACALAHKPAVLLLDEPTAGLSPVDRDEVWRVVGRRRERGATTIIATTSLQEALCVGDRAGLILDGSLQSVGTPAQLAEQFFPDSSLHFHLVEKPDRALLEELPEVDGVEIDERVDHWAIALATRQPRELRALLEADPEFPELLNLDGQQLSEPFAARLKA